MLYDRRWDKTVEVINPARAALVASRALIENPENWAQGLSYGWKQDQYCAMHAITVAAAGDRAAKLAAFDALDAAIGGKGITVFNDTHTHAEVLAAFDKAIAEFC